MSASWTRKATDGAARVARIAAFGIRSGLASPSAVPLDRTTVGTLLQAGVGVRTVHTLFAARAPDRLCLVDERRAWTWKETDLHINRVAHALRERWGVERGAPVVLCMENCAEYIVAWFAALRVGARCVHLSFDATRDEAGWALDNSRARVVFADARGSRGVLPEALARSVPAVAVGAAPIDGCEVPFDDLLASPRVGFPDLGSAEVRADSVVYTSGTTGRPKGAVRDFAALGVEELVRIGSRLPLHEGERHLVVSRLYHSGAQAFVMLLSGLGATFYIQRTFDAPAVLQALSDHQIHSTFLVPTMIRRLLALDEDTWARANLASFRALVSGAAPFPHSLRMQALRRLGPARVFDFYGATELGWVTLLDGFEMMERPRSVGRALHGHTLRIVDAAGTTLPTGAVGLIQVRSSTGMSGYLDNRAATDEAMRDGWFTVEDTGRLDAHGYLWIEGRARDMILSGGVNVYPAEVEEALLVHPDVVEVAVIGLPDEEWGERVAAVVVTRSGSTLDADALRAWARERVASYKLPRAVYFVDELPRNPTGKVLKNQLRATFTGPST
jgi:fatty-acyl-CoA synthase